MKLPPGHVAGQGVAKPQVTGGFGERMMRSMGWEAGQGLGKDGTGIKEAIQVKKKEDTVGVRPPPPPPAPAPWGELIAALLAPVLSALAQHDRQR